MPPVAASYTPWARLARASAYFHSLVPRMPLTKQLTEQAEREKLEELERATPAPEGRSGEGAESLLRHLARPVQGKPGIQSIEAADDKPSRE
jgi:hypothetical protein